MRVAPVRTGTPPVSARYPDVVESRRRQPRSPGQPGVAEGRALAPADAARPAGGTPVRLGTPARRPGAGPEVHEPHGTEHEDVCSDRGAGAGHGEAGTAVAAPLEDAAGAERLRALESLIELLRPAVQSDGGDLVLVSADPERGEVEVQLEGACSSCAISATTLQAGVERILKDRLPWVKSVHGRVDDAFDLDLSASLGRGGYVPRA